MVPMVMVTMMLMMMMVMMVMTTMITDLLLWHDNDNNDDYVENDDELRNHIYHTSSA